MSEQGPKLAFKSTQESELSERPLIDDTQVKVVGYMKIYEFAPISRNDLIKLNGAPQFRGHSEALAHFNRTKTVREGPAYSPSQTANKSINLKVMQANRRKSALAPQPQSHYYKVPEPAMPPGEMPAQH